MGTPKKVPLIVGNPQLGLGFFGLGFQGFEGVELGVTGFGIWGLRFQGFRGYGFQGS